MSFSIPLIGQTMTASFIRLICHRWGMIYSERTHTHIQITHPCHTGASADTVGKRRERASFSFPFIAAHYLLSHLLFPHLAASPSPPLIHRRFTTQYDTKIDHTHTHFQTHKVHVDTETFPSIHSFRLAVGSPAGCDGIYTYLLRPKNNVKHVCF